MIGNKLEQSIIDIFQRNITSTYSINEVSKILKKSYPNIHKKLTFFLNEGILDKIDSGNSFKCYLDLSSEKARIFMSINELNYREEFLRKNKDMEIFHQQMKKMAQKYGVLFTILHKGKVLMVLKDLKEKSDIIRTTNLADRYEWIFLAEKQFLEYMLSDVSVNNDHIIFSGIENYMGCLSMLKEKLLIKMLEEKKK